MDCAAKTYELFCYARGVKPNKTILAQLRGQALPSTPQSATPSFFPFAISSIDASSTYLGLEGVKALLDFVALHHTIHSLSIPNSGIDGPSVSVLLCGIPQNNSRINGIANTLHPSGAMTRGLGHQQLGLMHVDMSGNTLTTPCARSIWSALGGGSAVSSSASSTLVTGAPPMGGGLGVSATNALASSSSLPIGAGAAAAAGGGLFGAVVLRTQDTKITKSGAKQVTKKPTSATKQQLGNTSELILLSNINSAVSTTSSSSVAVNKTHTTTVITTSALVPTALTTDLKLDRTGIDDPKNPWNSRILSCLAKNANFHVNGFFRSPTPRLISCFSTVYIGILATDLLRGQQVCESLIPLLNGSLSQRRVSVEPILIVVRDPRDVISNKNNTSERNNSLSTTTAAGMDGRGNDKGAPHHVSSSSAAPFFYADTEEEIEEKIRLCRDPSNNNLPWLVVILEDETYPLIISKAQYNALLGVGADIAAEKEGRKKRQKKRERGSTVRDEGDSDGESFAVNAKLAARSSDSKQRRLISHGVGGLINELQQPGNSNNNNNDVEGKSEMDATAANEDDFENSSSNTDTSDSDETDDSMNSSSNDEDREAHVHVKQLKRHVHQQNNNNKKSAAATPTTTPVLSPLIHIIVKYGIHYSGRRALEPLVDRLGRQRAPIQRSPTSIVLFTKDERPETVDEVNNGEGWASTRPSSRPSPPPPPPQQAAESSLSPADAGEGRGGTQPRSLIASGKVSSAANIFALRHRIQQQQQQRGEKEKGGENLESFSVVKKIRPHTTPSAVPTAAASKTTTATQHPFASSGAAAVAFTPKAPDAPSSAAAAAAASLQQLHRTDEDLQRAQTYWEFVILLQRLPSPGFIETSTSTVATAETRSCGGNEKRFADDHDYHDDQHIAAGASIETAAMRLVSSALTQGPLSLLSHTLLQTLRSLGAEDLKKQKRREDSGIRHIPASSCSRDGDAVEVAEEEVSPQKKPHQVSNIALVLLPPLYDSEIFSRFNRHSAAEKEGVEKSVRGSFESIPSSFRGPTTPAHSPPPAVLSLAVLSYLYNSLTTVYGDDEANTAVEAPKSTASLLETVQGASSSDTSSAAVIPNSCAILKILMNSTSPSLVSSYLSNRSIISMFERRLDAATRQDEEENEKRRSSRKAPTINVGLFPALLTVAGVGLGGRGGCCKNQDMEMNVENKGINCDAKGGEEKDDFAARNAHAHANAFMRSNPYYLQNECAWMTIFGMSGIFVELRDAQHYRYLTENESTTNGEGILSRLEKAIAHVLSCSSLVARTVANEESGEKKKEHGDNDRIKSANNGLGSEGHQQERSYFLSTSVTFLRDLATNITKNEHITDPNVREVISYCVPPKLTSTTMDAATSSSSTEREDVQGFSFPLILYGGKSTGKQKSIAEALTRIALSSVANAALELVEEKLKNNYRNNGDQNSSITTPTPSSTPPIIIPYFAETSSLVSFLFFVINALNTVEKAGSNSDDSSNADCSNNKNKGKESIPPMSQPEELAAYVHHRLQNSRIINGAAGCSVTPRICFVIINAHKLETPYRHTARGGNGKDALSVPFTEPPHAEDVRRHQNNLSKLQSSRLGGGGGGGGKGGVVSVMSTNSTSTSYQNRSHGSGSGDGSSSESLLLRWLPAALPSHIRVVMTIDTASPLLSALRARVPQPYEKLCVSPFTKHFTLNQIYKYSSSVSLNRSALSSKNINGWISSSLWLSLEEEDKNMYYNYQYGSSSRPSRSSKEHCYDAREQEKEGERASTCRADSDDEDDDASAPPAPPPRRLTSKATEDSVVDDRTAAAPVGVVPFSRSLALPVVTDPSSSRAHQHQDRFNMLAGDVLERGGPFDPDHRNGIDYCVHELPCTAMISKDGSNNTTTRKEIQQGDHRQSSSVVRYTQKVAAKVSGQLPLSSQPSPVAEALLAKEESDTFWYPPLVVSFMQTSKVFNGQYRYPKCLWSSTAVAEVAMKKRTKRKDQGEEGEKRSEKIEWTAETRPSTARTSRPTANGEEEHEESGAADADTDASVMRSRLASDRDEIDDFLEQCELFELEKGGQKKKESPRMSTFTKSEMKMEIASEKVRLFLPDSCAMLVRGILAHEEERLGIRTSQLESLEEKERERREEAERKKEEKLRKRLLRRQQQQQQQQQLAGGTKAQNEMNKQKLIVGGGEPNAMDNRSGANNKITNERRRRRAKARRPLAANADRFSKLDPSSALSFSSHRGGQGGGGFSFGDDSGGNPFLFSSSSAAPFSPEGDDNNNKNSSNNNGFFTLSEAALMRDLLLMLVFGGPLTIPELVKVISEAYDNDALRLYRSYAAACDEDQQQEQQQNGKEKEEEAGKEEQRQKERAFSTKFTSELRVLLVSVLMRLEKLHLIYLPSSYSPTAPLSSSFSSSSTSSSFADNVMMAPMSTSTSTCAAEKGSAQGTSVGQLIAGTSSHTVAINGAAVRDGVLKFYGEQRGLGGGGNSAAAMMMMLSSAGGSEDGSGGSRRVTNRSRISEWSASRSMSRPSGMAGGRWHHPSTSSMSLRDDIPNPSLSLLHASSKYNDNNAMGMSFADSDYAATTATNLTDNGGGGDENNQNPTPSTATNATTMLTTHDNPEEELALRRMLASGVDFSTYQVALALFFKNELHRHLANVAETAASSFLSSSSSSSSEASVTTVTKAQTVGTISFPTTASSSSSSTYTRKSVPTPTSPLSTSEFIRVASRIVPRCLSLHLALGQQERVVLDWLTSPRFIDLLLMLPYFLRDHRQQADFSGRERKKQSPQSSYFSPAAVSSSSCSSVVCVPIATATLLYPIVLDALFQISAMAADLEEAFSSAGGYESQEDEEVNGEVKVVEDESPAAYSSSSFRQDLKEIEDFVTGPSPSSTIRSHRRTLLRKRIVSEFTTLLPFTFHGWSLTGVGGERALFAVTAVAFSSSPSSVPAPAKDTASAKTSMGSALLLPSAAATTAPPRPPISVTFQQEALLSLSPFDSIFYRRAVRYATAAKMDTDYEHYNSYMMTSMMKKKNKRDPFFIPLNSGLGETVSKMTVTLPPPRPQNGSNKDTNNNESNGDTLGGISSPSLLPKAILHCFSSSEIPTATIPAAVAAIPQQQGSSNNNDSNSYGLLSPLQLRCLVVCTTRDEVYVLNSNTGLAIAYLSTDNCLVDDECDYYVGNYHHNEDNYGPTEGEKKKKTKTVVEFVGTILVPSSFMEASPSQVSSSEEPSSSSSYSSSCSSPMLAVVIAKERVIVWDFLKAAERDLRRRRQQRSQEDNDEKENDNNPKDNDDALHFGVTPATARREQLSRSRGPQAQASASHDDKLRCVVRNVTASVTRKIFCSVSPSEAAFYIDSTNINTNVTAPLNCNDNNIGSIHQPVAAAANNSSSSRSTSLVVLRDIYSHAIKFLDVDRGVVVKTFTPDPSLVQIGNESSPSEEEKQRQAHHATNNNYKSTATTSANTAVECEVSPHPPPPPPRRKEKGEEVRAQREATSVRFAATPKELEGQEFTPPLHQSHHQTAVPSSPYFSRVVSGGGAGEYSDDDDEDEDSNRPPLIIIREASFTKDGDLVLVSNYDVIIYSAGAGLPISSSCNAEENPPPRQSPPPPTVLRHLGLIHAFSISEDGLLVATVVGCEAFLWISKTGALLHVCRVPSPRDEAIYVDNAHNNNHHNTTAKKRVGQGAPEAEGVNDNHGQLGNFSPLPDRTREPIAVFQSICFHPNGNTLLASTSTGTVAVFSTFSGKLTKILYVLPRSAIVDSLLHRNRYKNGNQKSSKSASAASLLEGLVQHSTQFSCTSISFTPDHLRVVAAAGPLLVQWDATTFEAVGAVVAHSNSSITDLSVAVKRVVITKAASSSSYGSASSSPYDDDKVTSTLVQDHLLTVSASGEAKVWNFSDQLTTAREALRGVVSSQKGGLHRGGTVADDVLVKINIISSQSSSSTNPTTSIPSTIAATSGRETSTRDSLGGGAVIVPLKTKLIQVEMISPSLTNESREGRGEDDVRDKIMLCLTQPTCSGEEVLSTAATPPRPDVHNGHPAAVHDTFSSNPVITIPPRLVAGGGGGDGKEFLARGGTFNTLTAWRWYCGGGDDDDHTKKDKAKEKEERKIPSGVHAIRDDMLHGNRDRNRLEAGYGRTQKDEESADHRGSQRGEKEREKECSARRIDDTHYSRPADASPSSSSAAAAAAEEEDLLDFDPKAFEQMLRKQRLNSERKYFRELNKENPNKIPYGERRVGGVVGKETEGEVKQSLPTTASRRPTPPSMPKPTSASSPPPSSLSSAAAKGGEQKANYEGTATGTVLSLISPTINMPLDTFFTRKDKERGKVWSISGISTFITVSLPAVVVEKQDEEEERRGNNNTNDEKRNNLSLFLGSSSFPLPSSHSSLSAVVIVAIALNTHVVVLCASTGRQIAAMALPAMTVDPAGLKWELLDAQNNFILLTSSSSCGSEQEGVNSSSLESTAIHLIKLDVNALSQRLSSLFSQPPHPITTNAHVFGSSAALDRGHSISHANEKPQEEACVGPEIIKFISSSLSSHRGRVLDARTVKSSIPIQPRGSVTTAADRREPHQENEKEEKDVSLLSLITVATDGALRVWSVANLAERASLKIHAAAAAAETKWGDRDASDNQLSNYVLGKYVNSRITAASISLSPSSSSSASTFSSSEPAIRDGEYGVNITLFFEKSGIMRIENDDNNKKSKTVEGGGGGCVSSMRVACCPRPIALSKQTNEIRRGSLGINVSSPHCPVPPRYSSSARPTMTSSTISSSLSPPELEGMSLFESLSLPNSPSPFWKILETRYTTSVAGVPQGSDKSNNANGNRDSSSGAAACATLRSSRRTLVVPILGDLLLRAREGTTNLTLFDVQSLRKVQSVGIFRRFFTLDGTYPSIGGDDDDNNNNTALIGEATMRNGGAELSGGGVVGDLERLRAVSCISFLPTFGASSLSVPTPSGRVGWVVCGCTTGEVLVYELFL